MATRATMTNKQLAEALKMLGFIPKDAQVDIKGGQTTTFASKLEGVYGVDPQKFAQARAMVEFIDQHDLGADFYDAYAKTTFSGLDPIQAFERLATERLTPRSGGADLKGLGVPSNTARRTTFTQDWARLKSELPAVEPLKTKPGNIAIGSRDIQTPQRGAVTGLPAAPKVPAGPAAAAKPPGGQKRAGAGPTGTQSTTTAADTLGGEAPLDPAAVREEIYSKYGWAAGLLDIPEIAAIMNDVSAGKIDVGTANRRLLSTNYYKTTTQAERSWKERETTDPADAARTRQLQFENLRDLATKAGMDPASVRLDELTDLSLRFGWSEGEVARFLGSEAKYDPSKVKSGTLKALKDEARLWLVPLSDQTMTTWAQSVVGGTKTIDDFREYARGQAKSMFPGLATALDDPNLNTRAYLDPYAQVIGKTLGVNEADIDWDDPKYLRFVNQIDPKTSQRTVMSLADTKSTLMADDTYGYDKTDNGRAQKNALGRQLLERFGFSTGGGGSG
jgi:hypothetical protein